MDLGKEVVKNYLLNLYQRAKSSNSIKHSSFLKWKEDNVEIVSSSKDSQLIFDLGNVLINLILQLKLVKISLKILARDEKINILVPGPIIENIIPNNIQNRPIMTVPYKIPMIVPPRSYKWVNNNYTQLGGYLLNDKEYTDLIILPN
jgi:hypothetical protein